MADDPEIEILKVETTLRELALSDKGE